MKGESGARGGTGGCGSDALNAGHGGSLHLCTGTEGVKATFEEAKAKLNNFTGRILFEAPSKQEALRLEADGTVFLLGEQVAKDPTLYQALVRFLSLGHPRGPDPGKDFVFGVGKAGIGDPSAHDGDLVFLLGGGHVDTPPGMELVRFVHDKTVRIRGAEFNGHGEDLYKEMLHWADAAVNGIG